MNMRLSDNEHFFVPCHKLVSSTPFQWWTLVTCVHLYYLPRDNYVHVYPFQVMMDFYGIIRFCCIQNKTVQTNKNKKTSTK